MVEEVLRELIVEGLSSRKIAKLLDTSQSTVNYFLKKYHLRTCSKPGPKGKHPRNLCGSCGKLVNRTSKSFCNSNCHAKYRYTTTIEEWQSGLLKPGINFKVPNPVRKYLLQKYANKCCLCGWAEVNPTTQKIPLELDHIDGNWKNNSEENLRIICPNCHSLTNNYRALNVGKGRTFRYDKS